MQTFQYTNDHKIIITNNNLQYEDGLNNFNEDCIKLGLNVLKPQEKWFVVDLKNNSNILPGYSQYILNVDLLLDVKAEREINQLPAPWLRK